MACRRVVYQPWLDRALALAVKGVEHRSGPEKVPDTGACKAALRPVKGAFWFVARDVLACERLSEAVEVCARVFRMKDTLLPEEDTAMTMLNVRIEADNLAQAVVVSASERAVYVKLDPEIRWDAEGLLRLSAMLKGVAHTLEAKLG